MNVAPWPGRANAGGGAITGQPPRFNPTSSLASERHRLIGPIFFSNTRDYVLDQHCLWVITRIITVCFRTQAILFVLMFWTVENVIVLH